MIALYAGKTALVTGAASGIGSWLAKHLADHGATILCVDINEQTGRRSVDDLNMRRSSHIAHYIKADVTSWPDVVNMYQTASTLINGKLDFVFANAGAAMLGYPDEPGKPNLCAIEVNLIGVAYTIQAAIHHFRSFKSGGSIVVTASQASLHPFGGEPIYTASKHGVLGLVRATAMRTEAEGIYINAVAPGSTSSSLMPKHIEDAFNSRGWKVSKEKIMEAFDMFLTPGCTLSGQLAEAVGEQVNLYKYSIPTKDKTLSRL